MTPAQAGTVPVEDVHRGDVVRFTPRAHRRRVTISVTHTYGHGSLMGYRAGIDAVGHVISRGMEPLAYFALPGHRVEVLRRAGR
jgi:hypothetical protein